MATVRDDDFEALSDAILKKMRDMKREIERLRSELDTFDEDEPSDSSTEYWKNVAENHKQKVITLDIKNRDMKAQLGKAHAELAAVMEENIELRGKITKWSEQRNGGSPMREHQPADYWYQYCYGFTCGAGRRRVDEFPNRSAHPDQFMRDEWCRGWHDGRKANSDAATKRAEELGYTPKVLRALEATDNEC